MSFLRTGFAAGALAFAMLTVAPAMAETVTYKIAFVARQRGAAGSGPAPPARRM